MGDTKSGMAGVLRIVLPIVIMAAGIVGFVALGSRRGASIRPSEETRPPLVETARAEAHDEGLEIEVDGVVVPFREVSLATEIAGRILHKAEICQAGNFVTKGTLLVEIDPRDYDLEVRRLEKELRQAEVTIKELEVETANTKELIELAKDDLRLQRDELERQSKLAERGVATASTLDQAKQKELAARNALLMLQNKVNLLSTRRNRLEGAREYTAVRLEKAQLDRARTRITSPIDGVIVRELVESDTYVNKGTPLVNIEDTSAAEVKCNLRMDELYWIWNQPRPEINGANKSLADYQIPATPATVVYSLEGRDYCWDGVLSRYDGIGLDEATRTVPCLVVVDRPREVSPVSPGNPSGRSLSPLTGPPALVRGMFVAVKIHTRPRAGLLRISAVAVRPGERVWVVRDNKLGIVNADVVRIMNDVAIIRAGSAGLRAGENVVVTPLAAPKDGMTVREKKGK